ncbi:MAG: cobalamin B12-binding domain-containing protein, partial [Deltaproteobacteria bacterium]|nr:cobalamin B12-binding domain-containing protein [Deltaproteobacteria bacterium]
MPASKPTRVLLVRPRPPADSIGLHHFMICDPSELTQVAAALPPQFDVRVFDGILEGGDRALRRCLTDFQPDVVAATCYLTGGDAVGRIFAAARAVAPRALRVVGGVHATLNSEDFIKVGPDVLVAGEGTFTFRDLCVAWRDAGPSGLGGIPGTALFNGAGFDFAAPRPWPSPDDVPMARRELVRRHWPQYYYIYHRPCFMLKTAF